jgi:hypothetical protein
VWPLPIHHGFGELSLAVDHASISAWSPPALTRRHGRKDKAGSGARAALDLCTRMRTKKERKYERKGRLAGGARRPARHRGKRGASITPPRVGGGCKSTSTTVGGSRRLVP